MFGLAITISRSKSNLHKWNIKKERNFCIYLDLFLFIVKKNFVISIGYSIKTNSHFYHKFSVFAIFVSVNFKIFYISHLIILQGWLFFKHYHWFFIIDIGNILVCHTMYLHVLYILTVNIRLKVISVDSLYRQLLQSILQ